MCALNFLSSSSLKSGVLEALSGEIRGLLETLVRQHSCSLKGIDPGDKQVQQVSVVLNCSGDIGLESLVACLKTLKVQKPSGEIFGTHGPGARQSHINRCSVHRTLCIRR